MAIPVIAIVGCPNVGKSTLFNCLTRSRNAIVSETPGMTRDRQYGEGFAGKKTFIAIDTGGLFGDADEDSMSDLTKMQSLQAIHEADIVLFVVDGKVGLTPGDIELAAHLRTFNQPVFLVINKIDGLNIDNAIADFFTLGFQDYAAISAAHNKGVKKMISSILPDYEDTTTASTGIKVAIVGRPNVGKSTLTNRILGEERVIVCDEPGTTRDSIYIPFTRRDKNYLLIDTAGVRKRTRIKETMEKFSVIKSLQAIHDADVVLYLLDATSGVSNQDLRLLGFCLEEGRALVIAINKWDGLETDAKDQMQKAIDRKLPFVDFAKKHFISALHGSGVGSLFNSIEGAYRSAMIKPATSKITKILQAAMTKTPPPLKSGRKIKLRYAHLGGSHPPLIIIHGNRIKALPLSYKRYLTNYFRKALNIVGTPIRLQFKTNDNPYDNK